MNKYRNIGPNEVLPAGTEVSIRNMKGRVVSCDIVDAIPDGKISIHTVLLTHKTVPDFGYNYKTVPLKAPKKWRGNYTAIIVKQ
jgi:hypothetical protein